MIKGFLSNIGSGRYNCLGIFAPLLTLLLLSDLAQAQGINTQFGKNRVQYHDFEWSFYESPNFIVYFYQGGQDLARFVLQVAENNKEDLENKLEHQLSSKAELLIYHNHADLIQTNLGLDTDFNNTGGTTQIIGNKIFIAYNGNHRDLERDVKEGIARVYLDNLIFGGNIQEVIQNAVLLNLPGWFTSGLVAFLGEEWNETNDYRLKKSLEEGRFKKINQLRGEEATFVGHSIWYYIAQNYGASSIPNILYLTRVNRSVESGFLFVIGQNVKQVVFDWREYFENLYAFDGKGREEIPIDAIIHQTKNRHKNTAVNRAVVSPKGDMMAFATNNSGKTRVVVKDFNTADSKRVLKSGFKTFDFPLDKNYPLLAWNKKGTKLAIIYEKRDQIRLEIHDYLNDEKERHLITKFQQVVDFDFTFNDRRLVMAAVKRGQADLYSYFIPNTKVTQLTNDFYDDTEVHYARFGAKEGIAFTSNRSSDSLIVARLDTIMPTGKKDLWFFDVKKMEDPLIRVTDTPLSEESQPQAFSDGRLSYVSDENGLNNVYVADLDSSFAHVKKLVYYEDSIAVNPTYDLDSLQAAGLIDTIINTNIYAYSANTFAITNLEKGVEHFSFAPRASKSLITQKDRDIYNFYLKDEAKAPKALKLLRTPFKEQQFNSWQWKRGAANSIKGEDEALRSEDARVTFETEVDSSETEDYYFQTEFDEEDEIEEYEEEKKPTKKKSRKFRTTRVRTYAPRFAVDYVITQVDNSIIFNQYQPFNGQGGGFNPDLKALIRLGASDLFEDYKILGGFRFPIGSSGTEYFIEFQSLKKRLDKKILLYRNAQRVATLIPPELLDIDGVLNLKSVTTFGLLTLTYPLDIVRSFRWHFGYRQDKLIPLADEPLPLFLENSTDNWLQTRLEYVFDNTIRISENLLEGLRYKFYIETHKPFNATITDDEFDLSFKNTGLLWALGGDIRHYQKIHKQITWANRLNFGKSFGSKRILYYLGGVDNWMQFNPEKRFDSNGPPTSPDVDYIFQSIEPNLRGFKQNVRSGSNFVLFNSEIRIPIFAYLFSNPIKSEFLRNFQFTLFGDVGTAWEKGMPWDEENRYFTFCYPDGDCNNETTPVVAQVRYFKNPFVYGYGFGARTKLLGYFIKVDRAWGIDSGIRQDPVWYVSLGYDF